MTKKLSTLLLSLLLAFSLVPGSAHASSKVLTVKVSAKTMYTGGKITVKIQNAKKGYRVKFATSNSKIFSAPATKMLTKTSYSTTVKGKKAGTATLRIFVQKKVSRKWKNLKSVAVKIKVKQKEKNPTDNSGQNTTDNSQTGDNSGSADNSGSTDSTDPTTPASEEENPSTEATGSDSSFTLRDSNSASLSGTTNGTVTTYIISEGGEYTASGDASGVQIDITSNENVSLKLNGINIDNSALSNETAVITQENNITTAIISSGTSTLKGNASGSAPSGVIYAAKGDLSFEGNGTLNIIDALADTPSASKALETSDGIRAKKGSVSIKSGDISIDTYGDGIQVKKDINISGGNLTVKTRFKNNTTAYYTTGTGSVSEKNTLSESNNSTTKTEYINIDTGSHKGLKAGVKEETVYVDGTLSEDDTVTSASGGIYITGGTVNIDTTACGLKANQVSGNYSMTSAQNYIIGAPDDAIHSNNNLEITGGTVECASGDDAVTAANTLKITGSSDVTISKSYEGIEASDITVGTGSDSPKITLNTGDDGINAAKKISTYYYVTENGETNEDYNYKKVSVAQSGNKFTMNSGNLYVRVPDSTQTVNGISYTPSGDGIDANGSIYAKGGTIEVYTRASGDNSPLDSDNDCSISGATILAAGAASMDAINSSGQGIISMNGNFSAGSAIQITGNGTTLFSKTIPQASSFVFYSSPEITSGSNYNINGTSVTASESVGGMMPGGNPGDNSGGFHGGNPGGSYGRPDNH